MAIPGKRPAPGDEHIRAVDGAPPPLNSLRAHAPNITLGALRIAAGLMFMQHGAQKFFGAPAMPNVPAMPAPELFSQLWFAGSLELVGGALIALGLFTRVVGFILSGEMAFAYFLVHAKRGLFPAVNGGELAVLYCFIFLAFAGLGGGAYSLDHLIAMRRGRPTLTP